MQNRSFILFIGVTYLMSIVKKNVGLKCIFKKIVPFLSLTFIIFALASRASAKAGAYIYLKNNCEHPISYNYKSTKKDDTKQNTIINSHDQKKLGYFEDTKFKLSFQSHDNMHNKENMVLTTASEPQGQLALDLKSGWTNNLMKVLIRKGHIDLDRTTMQWHSWYGTPAFTVIACPQEVNIAKSKIFHRIKRVLIFGDSISDTGNLHNYTFGQIPKSGPYYSGTFCNGPLWSALLKQSLGNQVEVSNYAVAGAQTSTTGGTGFSYSLADEYSYYKLNKVNFNETAKERLAFIVIGANDYLYTKIGTSKDELNKRVRHAVSNIIWMIHKLKSDGVKHFVVSNLPDFSVAPEVLKRLKNKSLVEYAIQTHNSLLNTQLHELYHDEQRLKQHIQFMDFYDMSRRLFHNTDHIREHLKIHISVLDEPCLEMKQFSQLPDLEKNTTEVKTSNSDRFSFLKSIIPNTRDLVTAYMSAYSDVCTAQENYFFWDSVHVSSKVHDAVFRLMSFALDIKFNFVKH